MSEVNHELLSRPFPKESIKQRRGNGNIMLSYLETHTVIRRLIEATGNNFDFKVLSIDQTDDLVVAKVELEIPGLGKRQHCGSARVVGGNNEDTIKCAISDSIKKVSSLFLPSILALYGPDYEAERPQAAPATRPAQAEPPMRTSTGAPVNRAVAMAGNRTFRQA